MLVPRGLVGRAPQGLAAILLGSLALLAQAPEHRLFDAPVLRAGAAGEVQLLGDADGDGDVDLVAFTAVGNTAIKSDFRVLFNDGSGRFANGPAIAIPPTSGTWVEFGDVSGDGLPDLVVSSLTSAPSGAGLWLFRSTGGGTFAAPVHAPLPGNVLRLHLGDADADGRLDVLAMHFGAVIDLYLAWFVDTASGLSPTHTAPIASTSIGATATFELDGDGRSDCAILEQLAAGWLLHVVRTTAAGFELRFSLPVAAGLGAELVAGDWDLDGDEDLLLSAVTGVSQNSFTPLLNHFGNGLLPAPTQVLVGMSIARVFAGDMDGDGDLDLMARGLSSGTSSSYPVARLRNDARAFSWSRMRTVPQSSLTLGAGLADLDGDGRADFADSKAVWFSRGSLAQADAVGPVFAIDWDDDGDLDSVQRGELLRHDGAGAFAVVPGCWPTLPTNEFHVEPIHVGDFDGDGATDVIVPRIHQIFSQQTFLGMRRLEANGNDLLVDQGSAAPLPLRMTQGVVFDLDGDGDLDVLDGQGAWTNDGTGLFSSTPLNLQGFRPVAQGDVDGDGDPDFLAVNAQGPPATALLIQSSPIVYSVVVLSPVQAASIELQSAILADLDDDGDLDVACRERTSTNAQRTRVFVNTAGTFTPGPIFPQYGRLAAGDVDLDGRTDLVVFEGLQLHVLLRLPGALAHAAPVSYAFGGPSELIDLDQDGDLDLVGTTTLLGDAIPADAAGRRRQYGTGGLGLDARRPLLSAIGPIRSGQPLSMRVRRALGGSFGVLVFSTGPANLIDVLPGLTAYVASIDAEFVLSLGGAPGLGGAGGVDASFPLPPGTAGTRVWSQFVALDAAAPSGLVHSNGVELRIGQ